MNWLLWLALLLTISGVWALVFVFRKPRCKARLKRGEDPKFYGRCELAKGHYAETWEDQHLLKRGHVNVRWVEGGRDQRLIRYEQ